MTAGVEEAAASTAANADRNVPRRRRWWLLPAKAVLTVAATWLIMRGAGLRLAQARDVDWTLVELDPAFLALSAALLSSTFILTAVLWRRILREFGDSELSLTAGTAILLVANLGRYVPGKVLHLAGVAVLCRRAGISGFRAAASAVIGQVLTLLGAVVVGSWVFHGSAADGAGQWRVGIGLAVVLLLAALIYLGAVGRLLRWILLRASHTETPQVPGGGMLMAVELGYIANWLVHGAAFACLARGLGLELPLAIAATTFAAAYFAGYVAVFAPAGIGVREVSLAALLLPVLGADASIALAVLQRLWMTVAELAGAALGVFMLPGPGPHALRTAAVETGTSSDSTAGRS